VVFRFMQNIVENNNLKTVLFIEFSKYEITKIKVIKSIFIVHIIHIVDCVIQRKSKSVQSVLSFEIYRADRLISYFQ